MFKALREKFSAASSAAKSKSIEDISEVAGDSGRRLKESVLDDVLNELQMGLLEADVALPVAEELAEKVRASLAGKRID
ncbi:MAG: Signal recognition particle receptor FtsY, partial [Candidatus Thermoplasmatota archaeon]|nr:Signal recognition particle receptor FtsY [Candidatus Thermoplasmatota archaeon]